MPNYQNIEPYSNMVHVMAQHGGPEMFIEYLLEIMPNIDFMKSPEKLDDFLPWSKQTQSIF